MSPSGLSVHDSARLAPIFCPGSGRTSASWIAYITPKGVIWGGAVDGSNQLGAIVTWKDTAISPAGSAACDGVAAASANPAIRTTPSSVVAYAGMGGAS